MLRPIMSVPSSPIRLADVARRAGVSVMTASRALHKPGLVAPETRARIEAAANALGYVPNLVAGALASARTRMAAVLVPTIASSIFADTVNGLTEALEAEGYAILLAQSGYDAGREEHALTALLGRRPEAVVMVGSPATSATAALLRRTAAGGTTVVEAWDLPTEPIGAAVGFDNGAAGAAVAAHFVSNGRRRLAFIGGNDARAAARWQGFAMAVEGAGLASPLRVILPAPAAMDDAAAVCAAAMGPGSLMEADAVFAATDVHALGLLTGLRARGRRVPEDVAVVGLGDLDIARHAVPPLTTLRIDGTAIGHRTAEVILADATGDIPDVAMRRQDVGFTLVHRESG
jgi:LacI family transcriptional regulator, gluconate utilization system Gnt-I transcriptional repressor